MICFLYSTGRGKVGVSKFRQCKINLWKLFLFNLRINNDGGRGLHTYRLIEKFWFFKICAWSWMVNGMVVLLINTRLTLTDFDNFLGIIDVSRFLTYFIELWQHWAFKTDLYRLLKRSCPFSISIFSWNKIIEADLRRLEMFLRQQRLQFSLALLLWNYQCWILLVDERIRLTQNGLQVHRWLLNLLYSANNLWPRFSNLPLVWQNVTFDSILTSTYKLLLEQSQSLINRITRRPCNITSDHICAIANSLTCLRWWRWWFVHVYY